MDSYYGERMVLLLVLINIVKFFVLAILNSIQTEEIQYYKNNCC